MEYEMNGRIFFKKYKIKKFIANGCFGEVYLGENITNKKLFAVKIEDRKSLKTKVLEKEAYYLYNLKGYGIPEVISYGYSGKYNILIETLLGKSLYDLNLKNKFTIKDISMIGIQIIDRLKFIHSKFVIHCDIKPQNFLVAHHDSSIIYICDFGNAQKYRSSLTGKHVRMKKCKKYYFTPFYSSINSQLGYQPSRRDDLESLGYVLIYLFKGLPWEKIKFKNIDDYKNKIINFKKKIDLKKLCEQLPFEIYEYIKYVRGLKFEETPNYTYLKSLFFDILYKINENNDYIFSWCNKAKNRIHLKNNSFLYYNKIITSSMIQQIKYLIKRRNTSEKKKINNILRNEKIERNNELNNNKALTAINFLNNIAVKDNKKSLNKDIDLDVEKNYHINYV